MSVLGRQPLSREEFENLDSVFKAPGLVPTLISVFCAFGGWALLLSVIPLAVIDAGQSDTLAGLSTAVFMGATVLTQAFTPRVLRMVGYLPVMLGAALLLGLPAVLHVFTMTPLVIILVAIVRGIGFGSLTVAESALIADLVPVRLLGRASGVLGLSVGIGELLGFPLGMYLFDNFGPKVVFSAAGVYAIVGAIAALGLPALKREGTPGQSESSENTDHVEKERPQTVKTWKLATVPAILVCTASMGFAAFSTFLAPAAAKLDAQAAAMISGFTLSVVGGFQIISRLVTGWWADRVGEPGRLASIGQILSLVGLIGAGATIALQPTGWALAIGSLIAAAFFGLGFGIAQSEALLMMFNRLPRSRSAEASALWNMAFDSGTGIGAMLLGLLAGYVMYLSLIHI